MIKLFNYNGSVIDDKGIVYKVSDILHYGDEVFLDIPSRSLVLLLCQNTIDSLFFYINCIERKVVPILIDTQADYSLTENIIERYNPDFIFAPSTISNNFSSYLCVNDFKSYNILKNNENIVKILDPMLSLLLSTSGTTGSPKLVRLSYSNLVSNASSICSYLNITDKDRAISSLPMNYSFGLSIINSHLFLGGSILMTMESITQRKFWDLFNEFKVTSLSGVPYTFEILKKFRLLNFELPSLKKLTQAGGKLSNDLIEYFADFSRNKGIDFVVMYGQTEGTARLSYLPTEFINNKLGSIGMPIPGGRFHLVDENGVKIEAPETSGELIYIGPNVMLGYADKLDDLFKGDVNKGVLSTGDIAYFDIDGFYFIVGRIKRFIKIFGNRINLDELEQLLKKSDVDSVCVGKDNLLLVYLLLEENKIIVKDIFSKKLGIHPSAIELRIIQEFPKNESGKTLYSKLEL
jgi:acyl-CoA synthetase (AMP-forming)/AMP-acid ligase II